MALRAITVENYRCFREPFRLDLRPLTLLYGWNNAGKSAAVRLVRALGRSVNEDARAPLDTGDEFGYRDIVWRPFVKKPGALRFGLEWQEDGSPTVDRARWRLDLDRDTDQMYVRELELIGAQTLHLRADRAAGRDLYRPRNSDDSSREGPRRLIFQGLVPDADALDLTALRERLISLRRSCTWLRGDRARPPRSIASDALHQREIGDDGAGASAILLDPANDALFEAVRQWYARPEIRRHMHIREEQRQLGRSSRRILLDPIGEALGVDLVDTGAGMSQVLPVLTAVAAARVRVRAGSQELVAIEEPESQLHPNAQRALGQWLCELAAGQRSPQIVIETHSRVLILAVQLAVARGLDPQKVALYWLEQRDDGSTCAHEVTLDRYGRPDGQWPRDVFADELELAESLAEAQFAAGAWDS